VTLQKQGRWPAAQVRLEEARQLMANNLSASRNLNCNTNFQSGVPLQLADMLQVAEDMGGIGRLHSLMASCGPLDEPAMDYLMGNLLLKEGCPWQAAEQMERVKTLVPGALEPELILADVFNQLQMPGRSGPIISHLRAEAAKLPPNSTLDLNLALLEVGMSILETNRAGARETLAALLAEHPDNPVIASRAASAYLALGDLTNALRVADAQLARTPNDVLCLHKKAVILMQCGRSGEAIPLLDHILTITNLPPVRVSRAFAYLALENFGLAENDFRAAETEGNTSPAVSLGLAAVAEHNHDTNQAVHYLRLCLTNSPNHSSLWKQANARLQSLVPGTPAQ
jgi:predicted Zn-dependent protease